MHFLHIHGRQSRLLDWLKGDTKVTLIHLFAWGDSPEGHIFWENLHERTNEDYETQFNDPEIRALLVKHLNNSGINYTDYLVEVEKPTTLVEVEKPTTSAYNQIEINFERFYA